MMHQGLNMLRQLQAALEVPLLLLATQGTYMMCLWLTPSPQPEKGYDQQGGSEACSMLSNALRKHACYRFLGTP